MQRISKCVHRHAHRRTSSIQRSVAFHFKLCLSSSTPRNHSTASMGVNSNKNYGMIVQSCSFHSQRLLLQEQTKQSQSQLHLVTDVLREAVKKGEFVHDPAQQIAAKRLSNLQKALLHYSNETLIQYIDDTEQKGLPEQQQQREGHEQIEEIVSSSNNKSHESQIAQNSSPIMVPRGLFIHGNVGTGKTQLMDIFYNSSPIDEKYRKRVHFHSFMQDVHKRIHNLNKKDIELNGRSYSIDTSKDRNPIVQVGIQLASETRLLCFDEFQVTDVADALMLSQLFEQLFQRGTVVVATSNRHPETLYEGGLNRSYFLPFIDLLCRHCIVHDMNHDTDYRIITTNGSESYFFPKTCQESMKHYVEITNATGDKIVKDVKVQAAYKRVMNVPEVRVHGDGDVNIARFHFRDLCNIELGSSDYRVIAQEFNVLMIDDIPLLTLREHDQARRFITLVDELYEANCALICTTETATSPDTLFLGQAKELASLGGDAQNKEGVKTEAGEAFGIDVAQGNGMTAGGLASVQELSFAFKRAASRITEMTSKSWWEKNGMKGFE